jgi:hypothetical protein
MSFREGKDETQARDDVTVDKVVIEEVDGRCINHVLDAKYGCSTGNGYGAYVQRAGSQRGSAELPSRVESRVTGGSEISYRARKRAHRRCNKDM